jgi:hypothetical protein
VNRSLEEVHIIESKLDFHGCPSSSRDRGVFPKTSANGAHLRGVWVCMDVLGGIIPHNQSPQCLKLLFYWI